MGNQGTKNWKLTILFAVSLMLIAGLFSNTAMAHDCYGPHPEDACSDARRYISQSWYSVRKIGST